MTKYILKPPVIQALALVGLHWTLSWEISGLGYADQGLLSMHQFRKSIRKTAFWTCSTFPVSVLKLLDVNFEWTAFRRTQSGAHKDVLYPSASNQLRDCHAWAPCLSTDRHSCCLCFSLPSLVTSEWRPYELRKWEWLVLLVAEILWGVRLYCVTVME